MKSGQAMRWIGRVVLVAGLLHAPARLWAATVTLEAETMPTKTTGGAVTDGWGLWANGYVEGPATFPATMEYTFQVVARGVYAGGAWPSMELRIDQVAITTFTVNSSAWATFTTRKTVTAGSHRVAVAFTNDYYSPPQDRNLYIDKIRIDPPVPTPDTTPPTGSVTINGGAATAKNLTATLTLAETDNAGPVAQMQFSNTGTTYSAAVTYGTSKAWTLSTGDGTKTVYAKFKDAAGNWSAATTDTIVLDTVLPIISGITASAVTATSASINWTTNEPATSQVDYGLSTSYGQTTPLDTNLVTSHSAALSSLTAGKKHYYRVRSKDRAGNRSEERRVGKECRSRWSPYH